MVRMNYRVIEGDTLTPISIFLKLKGKKKFLLESSLKHEDSGRYSIIGAEPFYEMKTESFDHLEQLLLPNLEVSLDIPFPAGGVGYVAYDAVRQFESIGHTLPDPLDMPDIHLMFYEKVIVYDHLFQKIYLVAMDRWITNEQIDLTTSLDEMEHQ